MHSFLVQKFIDNAVYGTIYTECALIDYIDMSDCSDEEYRIFDISVLGKVREVFFNGWKPNRLIEIVDGNGNIIASGYGKDH